MQPFFRRQRNQPIPLLTHSRLHILTRAMAASARAMGFPLKRPASCNILPASQTAHFNQEVHSSARLLTGLPSVQNLLERSIGQVN